MPFVKATRAGSLLRLALFGPSGSGKTFSALRIAHGLGGKIAAIDSERGRIRKYADRDVEPIFTFDVSELVESKSIETYVNELSAAQDAGYNVLIIDSLTHPWDDLREEVQALSETSRYRGNYWAAWSEGTPKQRAFVDALLGFNGHIIATMRSKTEWTTDMSSGSARPKRVGLTPEQGKGIEYEFDLLIELDTQHNGTVIKDDTGKFQDKIIEKPDEAFGEELKAWLSTFGENEQKKGGEKEKPIRARRRK